MKWQDKGFVLAARRHGESSMIIDALTENHGRHAGYVRGGAAAKRMRGILTRGNLVHLIWQARLADQLGSFRAELETAHAARLMDDAAALDALSALCALAQTLPDRQPAPKIFAHFAFLLDLLPQPDLWPPSFVRFELALLADLGFGLDLNLARLSAPDADSVFISADGKAVILSLSKEEAKKKGFARLPRFLADEHAGQDQISPEDVCDGLNLTAWFLRKRVYEPRGQTLPEARQTLAKRLRRKALLLLQSPKARD